MDGFFSFEAERRGAKHVTAANVPGGPPLGTDGFKFAHDNLKSSVHNVILDIQRLSAKWYGTFDVVLMYGVLYHIKNPLIAIENCYKLTAPDGICLVETAISDIQTDKAVLEYRPGFDNDPTNFYYPNQAWMEAASKQAGFASCEDVGGILTRRTYKLTKASL